MIDVFKSLPTADTVVRAEAVAAMDGDASGAYKRDTITLGWEDRLKGRGRRKSDGGLEFGTTLPRGTVLYEGDALFVESLRLLVVVIERPEPVLVITPASTSEWGLYGYHIGNSHQPMMMTEQEIVCLDNIGMRQVLDQYDIPFVYATRPFTPIGQLADHRH